MAGKDLNYRINVNAAAGTAGIRDFSRAVNRELKSVDQSLDDTSTNAQKVARSLGKMADQAETELKSAARAADALGKALGPELAAQMGRDGIAQKIGDLKRMGLTFDEIEQDADELADAIKRIDQVQAGAQDSGLSGMATNAKKAAGATDELTDSALKGRNAMANMVGNAAQDMGALAGIAGSAGVALGQMAEGAADAANGGESLGSSLKGMATVVGPIAAIGLAVNLLNEAFAAGKASDAFDAANVKQYTDALKAGTPIVRSFNDEVEETGEVAYRAAHGGGMLGLFSTTKDLAPVLERAGMSLHDFNLIVQDYVKAGDGSAEMNDRWRASLEAAGVSQEDALRIVKAVNQESDARTAALEKEARLTELLTGDTEEATRAFEKQENAVDAERRAHLRNNQALYESSQKFAEVRTAAQRAEDQARHTADAFDAIRRSLDMDAAIDDFQVNFLTAIAKVQGGTALTGDEIRGLKDDILSVATYAKLNPIQVKALLQAIDDGNIAGVMALAQSQINKTRLTAKVELQLAQGQTSTGRIGGVPISRAVPGPDALVAPGGGGTDDGYVPAVTSSGTDLGTVTLAVPAGASGNVTVDMRGAFIAGSRYDVVRMVRTATRDGVRLAGARP